MAHPVGVADGKKDILAEVEWLSQLLREHVDNIVIRVGAVVELGPEGALPFLRLQHVMRVGSGGPPRPGCGSCNPVARRMKSASIKSIDILETCTAL